MADVYGDGALGSVGLILPDALIDIARVKDLTGVFHEEPEDVVLGRREGGGLAVHGDGLAGIVHAYAADCEAALPYLRRAEHRIAPQLCAHARKHLKGIEGLGDVIVRADVQAEYLVRVLTLGREQDHGDVRALAYFHHGADAVHDRHHNVHEHKADIAALQQRERLRAVICALDGVALALEINFQRGDDILFVVADKHSVHAHHLVQYAYIITDKLLKAKRLSF